MCSSDSAVIWSAVPVCVWGSRENSLSTQCILFIAYLSVSKLNTTHDVAEGRVWMCSKGLFLFCHFTRCIKPMMLAFQRVENVRPATNNPVERHSTDQEDTETVTQVTWHKNGQKAQLEIVWTEKCVRFSIRSGWWPPSSAFHRQLKCCNLWWLQHGGLVKNSYFSIWI